MANYKSKLDLTKLRGAQVLTGKDGKRGMWIPIETAGLFESQKTGAVYLDIEMWERKPEQKQWGEHTIRQSMTPDFKNAYLTELAVINPGTKYIPDLGNTQIIVSKSAQQPAAQPAAQQPLPQQVQQLANAVGGATAETLPF